MNKRILAVILASVSLIVLSPYSLKQSTANEVMKVDATKPIAISKIYGPWSVSQVSLKYVDTGVGGINGSFSIVKEALHKNNNRLVFDSSGNFHSSVDFSSDENYCGQSLDFKTYNEWKFDEYKDASNFKELKGQLELLPVKGDFKYKLVLSGNDTLVLIVSEVYKKKSTVVRGVGTTKGGKVPMTYTITLMRTPESLADSTSSTR